MPRQQLYEYEGDRDYESYEIKALNGFAEKPWYIVRVYYFIPTETFEEEIVSPYFANKGSARRYAELHNIPLNKEIPVYSVYKNKTNNNMKHKTKLTESALRKMVRESIKKALLKESTWADGTEMTQAYHIITRGCEDSDQEEADFAYGIYDKLTHNEITTDEAIETLTGGDLTPEGYLETISRNTINFGTSEDGKYLLTYDQYTGAFDVWELPTENEEDELNREIMQSEDMYDFNKDEEALRSLGLNESKINSIIREVIEDTFDNSTIGSDVIDALNSPHNPKISQFRLGNVASLFQQAMTKCGVDDTTYVNVNKLVLQWITQ